MEKRTLETYWILLMNVTPIIFNNKKKQGNYKGVKLSCSSCCKKAGKALKTEMVSGSCFPPCAH